MGSKQSEKKLKLLEITCNSADCESGLHYFKPTKKMIEENEGGRCRYCGVELIDWSRFQASDLRETDYVF